MTKILYVEDYEPQRDFMVWLLELHGGYEVDVACDGKEGVKKAQEWHPDVVLMDIHMPGQIDGLAAIRQLRHGPDTMDIPIIVISAWGDVRHKVRALKAGADVHLTKPVTIDELLAAINRHQGGIAPYLLSKTDISSPWFSSDIEAQFVNLSRRG